MTAKARKPTGQPVDTEVGTVRKSWRGRTRIALVYPNRYHVGMSNLGFQSVYRLLNDYEHIVCERALAVMKLSVVRHESFLTRTGCWNAVISCLNTYVEFFNHSNIKMGLPDP